MAEKDNPGPSLELPSLFDRRKKRRASGDDTPTPSDPASEPRTTPAADATPAAAGDSQDTRVLKPAPAADAARAPATPTGQPTVQAPARSTVQAPAQPTAQPTTQPPATSPSRTPAQPTPQPTPQPTVAPTSQPAAQATAPPPHPDPSTGADEESTGRSMPSLPTLGAAVAALVVGALVGLLGVVLTFLGLKGCELVTGTDSCGGPGLLVLVAIMVAMVLAGAAMLRLFAVPDAGSVSFLGVGLLVVVVLVLLVDSLASLAMLAVIPALTAGCFAGARWVTTQLSDDVMADR